VLLASDRMESDAESEARTLLGYLVLQEMLAGQTRRPNILVELMTSENTWMFQSRGDEVLITPLLLSHILTQVALRRELNGVFDQLFGPDGTEFCFRPPGEYALREGPVTFADVQRAALAHGETALGLHLRGTDKSTMPTRVVINPDRDVSWEASDLRAVVVLRN
jgi:hypothetical protein